jgi:O-antigen/teichoic acid export membrane protein
MTTARALTQSVPTQHINWLEPALAASTGLVFGLYPEAAIGFACACALLCMWRFGVGWVLSRDLFILGFAAVRLIYAVRAGGPIWVALLEAVVTLLLPRAAWVLQAAWRRWFGYGIILGLCVSVGVAGVRAWSPDLNEFLIDQTRVRSERIGEVQQFHAISRDYAWVVQSLGVQGPAKVDYMLEVRTSRPYEFPVSFRHPGLPNNQKNSICKATTQWGKCNLKAELSRASLLDLVIGGSLKWKKGEPDIEIRSTEFQTSSPPSLLNHFRFADRQTGLSFNQNAFGAWMTVAGIIALCATQGSRAGFISIIPMALGVYLSGSRGVLLAAVLGLLTVILAQNRFAKLLGPVLLVGSLVTVGSQANLIPGLFSQAPTSASPSFRAFNLNDPNSVHSRMDIWHSGIQAVLSRPVFGPTNPPDQDISTTPLGQAVKVWTHAHNLGLQMLIEGGLLQLALLTTLVLFLIWRLAHSRIVYWLGPLVAILLINIGDFIFYYAPIRLSFGLLLGLQTMKPGRSKPHKRGVQKLSDQSRDMQTQADSFNPVPIVTSTQKQPVLSFQAAGETTQRPTNAKDQSMTIASNNLPKDDGNTTPTGLFSQPKESEVSGLVQGAAKWSIILLVVRQMITILATMVVSRFVTPADVGTVGMVITFVSFITLFDTALTWATVQAQDLGQERVNSLFWFGVGLGSILWITCVIAGPYLADFYKNQQLIGICMVMGMSPFLNSLTTQPAALLKRQIRQKLTNSIDTAAIVISSLVAVIMAINHMGVWVIVAQTITLQLVRLPLLLYFSKYSPGIPRITRAVMPQLKLGAGLAMSNVVTYFQLYFGSIMIGHVFGNASLGYYLKAYGLKSLPTAYAAMVVTDVMVAALAALQKNPEKMGAAYRKSLMLIAFVGCPAGALLFPMAPEMVQLLYGPQWGLAIPMLRWFALAAVMLPITTTTIWLFISLGKVREQLLMNIVLTMVTLVTYLTAVKFVNTAESLVILEGFLLAVPFPAANIIFSHRAVGLSVRETFRTISPIVLISVCTAAAVFFFGKAIENFHLPWLVLFGIKGIAGALIYLTLSLKFIQPFPIAKIETYLSQKLRGKRSQSKVIE